MTRRLVVLSVFILATLAAPTLFAANCHDCPDGDACISVPEGGYICGWNPDGSCYSVGGGCHSLTSASLQAEYRVAAVHVIEPGKPLPKVQPKPSTVLTASLWSAAAMPPLSPHSTNSHTPRHLGYFAARQAAAK